MSEENKEKSLVQPDENTGGNAPESGSADSEWSWDAVVPETATDDITVDEIKPAETEEQQENQDEPQEPEKEPEECIVCGKPIVDSASDLYCKECCQKFLHTNLGAGHIILAFVMVIAAAVSYFFCASTVNVSSLLLKAQTCVEEKRYDDAVNKCTEISDAVSTLNAGINSIFKGINENFSSLEWLSEGSRTSELVISAYADTISASAGENGDCSNFINAVKSVYGKVEKEGITEDEIQQNIDAALAKPENRKIKKVYDFCVDFIAYYDYISPEIQGFMSQKEGEEATIDYEKAMAYLNGLEAKNATEKSAVEYFKFIVAYYDERGKDVIIAQHKKANEAAGELGYMYSNSLMTVAWELEDYAVILDEAQKAAARNCNNTTAYYLAAKANIALGDFKKANAVCGEMKKNNPESLDYYSTKAEVLRREGKFDEAVKVCAQGIAAGSDPEIYRQQAIAYMLSGSESSALEAAKQAYDVTLQNAYSGGYVSLEALNTAALITFICNDTDTYGEIKDLFEQQGIDFEDSVKNCIKGDITFEDIFMKGAGEV